MDTLRNACSQGDFLHSAARLLAAEMEKDQRLCDFAAAGNVAQIAVWVEQETPLLEAVRTFVSEDMAHLAPVSIAKRLIWNYPDLSAEGAVQSGMSLGAAIRRGHFEAVRLMIAQGWDVNAPQADGRTPPFWADAHGQPEIAALLIAKGSRRDSDAPKSESNSLAQIKAKVADISRRYLQTVAGSSHLPEGKDVGLIHAAVQSGDAETLVHMIASNKALVSVKDKNGNSVLHKATTGEIARLLIAHGADVDARGWMGNRPLHDAASHGHFNVTRVLIESGADVNATRQYEMTPLHWAARGGHAAVVAFLIESGAVPDAEDGWGGTPLTDAIKAGHDECAFSLIALGADVNRPLHKDSPGALLKDATPLHWAAKFGRVAVVRCLLEAGAEQEAIDCQGNTPLHQAAAAGQIDVVRCLLDMGADFHCRNIHRNTPEGEAKENDHKDVLEILRQYERQLGKPIEPELPASRKVRAHPRHQEAVTLARRGILARWKVGEKSPHRVEEYETEHPRFLRSGCRRGRKYFRRFDTCKNRRNPLLV